MTNNDTPRIGYPTTPRTDFRIAHPEPQKTVSRIHPVFLPFAGCPGRCAFCNQNAVTGAGARPLEDILSELEVDLANDLDRGVPPRELGFFGGTFTALPTPWPQRFLELAERYREQGLITRVRCSTRPDATAPALLDELKALGLDLVELGIQSFHGPALDASQRGYDPATARAGCDNVLASGLELGVQLMPGLPGQDLDGFETDIIKTATLPLSCVRLYPCVVLRNTPLAETWEQGGYTPWELDETVSALADALLALWTKDIPVIRMGLPPEPGLENDILAGPRHPALGQLARSLALQRFLTPHIKALGAAPKRLLAPSRYRSDLLGHKHAQLPHYEALGLPLERMEFHDRGWFELS
ncbi:radical SAM protein [Desulfovibrio ferrophilus]|uniref:Radical SAM domain protein n=1 Tax=Desulfovibrio ferrophilus TaxID=241368 RepID=A0A2Z6B1Y8_9BACT|nr:radical SAM protein [Desulfovibrio ferrophilus]BBD09495.1 radical SAM domain protein [Desulfovibrio ferrophilus]